MDPSAREKEIQFIDWIKSNKSNWFGFNFMRNSTQNSFSLAFPGGNYFAQSLQFCSSGGSRLCFVRSKLIVLDVSPKMTLVTEYLSYGRSINRIATL